MGEERFDGARRPTARALEDERALRECYAGYRGADPEYLHAGREALERWWDWKFGIRIHWSVYAVTGTGPESWPLTDHRLGACAEFREQYEQLGAWWRPTRFDADEWADLFARAGLRYFTFTTKHHDGFSMFDTKTRVKRRRVHTGPRAGAIVECDLAYGIAEGAFGRDVTRELVDACRRRSLGVGLYFSHIDWFDSDFRIDEWNYQRDRAYTRASDPAGFDRMIARHREQIRELCTGYGPVDMLSLDMRFPADSWVDAELAATMKMARRLQPEMLIRNRGIGPYGDYTTPEREVPADRAGDLGLPWKVIYPGSKHFSRVWGDEYKPASWIVESLVDVCAKGGNFQVGYGPGPDGAWDVEMQRRLEDVGRWLAVNGEAIYATRPRSVFREGERVRFTRSKDGRFVYAIVLGWPEPPFDVRTIRLESVRARGGTEVRMLGVDEPLRYSQDDRALAIEVPAWFADPTKRPCRHAYAFRIDAEGTARP